MTSSIQPGNSLLMNRINRSKSITSFVLRNCIFSFVHFSYTAHWSKGTKILPQVIHKNFDEDLVWKRNSYLSLISFRTVFIHRNELKVNRNQKKTRGFILLYIYLLSTHMYTKFLNHIVFNSPRETPPPPMLFRTSL